MGGQTIKRPSSKGRRVGKDQTKYRVTGGYTVAETKNRLLRVGGVCVVGIIMPSEGLEMPSGQKCQGGRLLSTATSKRCQRGSPTLVGLDKQRLPRVVDM
jgi:hypothetical protein